MNFPELIKIPIFHPGSSIENHKMWNFRVHKLYCEIFVLLYYLIIVITLIIIIINF
jgi:hypothetical protein